jgi:hypothetical protein
MKPVAYFYMFCRIGIATGPNKLVSKLMSFSRIVKLP